MYVIFLIFSHFYCCAASNSWSWRERNIKPIHYYYYYDYYYYYYYYYYPMSCLREICPPEVLSPTWKISMGWRRGKSKEGAIRRSFMLSSTVLIFN